LAQGCPDGRDLFHFILGLGGKALTLSHLCWHVYKKRGLVIDGKNNNNDDKQEGKEEQQQQSNGKISSVISEGGK